MQDCRPPEFVEGHRFTQEEIWKNWNSIGGVVMAALQLFSPFLPKLPPSYTSQFAPPTYSFRMSSSSTPRYSLSLNWSSVSTPIILIVQVCKMVWWDFALHHIIRCSSLAPVAPLEAILFDIDGTLADSDPIHYYAFREMLQEVFSLPL